ncbi:MAG: sugar O-acyltransferase, sialic acid O-acetyltransferase NeuD family [Clostridia bacterium]|jgi:sugar O-acyltransferase (sialic acid O-acetyltransferase NeuD family)|nr:sugar O-acyltransferase, sialic acid O-acetyltransferase NeuD family [Clostridia bacterium]
MKEKLLIIGGGGHAVSVIETVHSMNLFEIEGIIDTKDKQKTFVNGIEVIGEDTELERLFSKKIGNAVIAVGSIGKVSLRRNLYKKCKDIGYSFPNIIDASAIVAKHITIGEGNFIGKGVILNTHVQIGNGCILNTGCIIEHGCRVEDFVHVAPGSVLCGGVVVKRDTHIGAHSIIIQNITVGESTLIGAGSVVIKDILGHKVAYGNPCREVRDYEQNNDYC